MGILTRNSVRYDKSVRVTCLFSLFLKKKKNYLFISLFLAALGLSCSTRNLSLWCVGSPLQHMSSRACGLSSCGAQAPECVGSVVAARGLSSCGMQAQQLQCVGSVVAACGLSCPTACGILVP